MFLASLPHFEFMGLFFSNFLFAKQYQINKKRENEQEWFIANGLGRHYQCFNDIQRYNNKQDTDVFFIIQLLSIDMNIIASQFLSVLLVFVLK